MGLRIIDRRRRSDGANHVSAYREHIREWGAIHGPMPSDNLDSMVKHYQSVRQRLHEGDEANALAKSLGERLKEVATSQEVRESSKDRQTEKVATALPHGDLDIAAVLELLKD